jgi:hypothetical protein
MNTGYEPRQSKKGYYHTQDCKKYLKRHPNIKTLFSSFQKNKFWFNNINYFKKRKLTFSFNTHLNIGHKQTFIIVNAHVLMFAQPCTRSHKGIFDSIEHVLRF